MKARHIFPKAMQFPALVTLALVLLRASTQGVVNAVMPTGAMFPGHKVPRHVVLCVPEDLLTLPSFSNNQIPIRQGRRQGAFHFGGTVGVNVLPFLEAVIVHFKQMNQKLSWSRKHCTMRV